MYTYDYDLTLPDGRSESGRVIGLTSLRRPGDYQPGEQASVSVKAVYELPDESEVYSAAETLTCTVGGDPPTSALPPAPGRRHNSRSGGSGNPGGRLNRARRAYGLLESVPAGPVGDNPGYSPAWMTTRPPSRTWMFRSCPSRSSMPASGVLSAASASTYKGWPSHSTVAP